MDHKPSAAAELPADAEQLLLAQAAIDSVSDLIFWSDATGKFIYANRAACTTLEYDRAELLTMRVSDVVLDFGPDAWTQHWQALKSAGFLAMQAELRSRSGRRILAEVSTRYITHNGHEYTSASLRDVTERTLAQREFLETREQFATIFRESPIAIAITRRNDGAILEANPAFEQLYGFDREELLGRTTVDLHMYGAQGRGELFHAFAADGIVRNLELPTQGKGGRDLVTSSYVAPISFQGQSSLLCMVADVTERKAKERELREREERLRVIFDTSQAGIVLVDAQGRITFANRRMAELLGCPMQEVIGSTYTEHLHPDQREVAVVGMHRLIAGDLDLVSTERHFLRQDGSDFWGFLSSRRHEDAAGKLVSLVGVIVDITARKQAEDKLRQSEERFRSLIELAADAIVQGNGAGVIVAANLAATTLSGYAPDELLGMNIVQLFSEHEQVRAPLRYDLLRAGETVRIERTLKRKDGTQVPIEMNSKMMPDGTFQTFVRDMSERKKAEDVLRASEKKFATAFKRAPLVMTISSREDGRLIDVNDKFCELSGFSREEALGRTSVELGLMYDDVRAGIGRELLTNQHLPDRELTITIKDGRQLQCLWGGEIVQIDGRPRLLTIVQDITETVRMREELAKTQKLESLGLLAGGLAHDFNNVLTGVLGNLSFARMLVGENHNAAQCLIECEKAAVRASELTRQLLTFSRGGAPTRKVVDTRRLIDEAVSFALRGSNVKAVLDLPPDLHFLNADEGQISQVFANLLINAKQAMPSGGTVTIRAANETVDGRGNVALASGSYVRIDVADTGPGIAPDVRTKIFDPYFTTKPGGTGLGLSSVYSIVRRHAGCVEVESEIGVGTMFSLRLPAAVETDAAPSDATEAALPHDGQGRILVMDDEILIRDLASRVLEALGYEAVACADGEAAVHLFREAQEQGAAFRAVLLDLTVPGGMGGKDAAALIRAMDTGVILIVSTGYSNDPIVADCQAYGFAGAVAKPYSVETLAEELTRLLGQRPLAQ